jgi:TRAP-type C4-dicarboxylate transport system substrate-binding protein
MTATGVRLATAGAALLMLVAGAGCSGSTDKAGGKKARHTRELRVLNTRGTDELQPFAAKVAEVSGGRLGLAMGDKWERGSTSSEVDAIHAVQAGQADLSVVSARVWHSLGVNDFDALVAPLKVDSMAVQQKVLASDIPTRMLAGVTKLGLVGIGVLPGPMRLPAGITRPLLTPADYAGARIAFSPSAVAARSLRALKAIPVESGFEGASISTDDGIEQQATSIGGNQYDGVVRTITANVNLWPRPLVVVANAKAFAGLSGHEQGWLRSAARDAVDATTKVQMQMPDLAPMCRRGKVELIDATATQLTELRAAFAPVYSWLRTDAATARYLYEIDALKVGVAPYPQEKVNCAGIQAAGAPQAAATPIDGVYEFTVTAAQLRAAGSVDELPENYGTYREVLNRGRWDETQRSDRAATWAHGTFTVQGGRLTFHVDEGGGVAPSGAEGKPGDSATMRWSLYRGQLTLRPPQPHMKPSDYPLTWTIHPWRRVGDAPAPSTTASPAAASPFEGTYRMVTTEAEAQKSDPNVPPENWGTWVFVFGRGRFAITQTNAPSCTWGYGTYLMHGSQIEWTFIDGGGIAPTGATNRPGEHFVFRWSRYRDQVTLAPVAGAVSPTNFLAEPWQRLSSTPNASYLSKRCPPPANALTG